MCVAIYAEAPPSCFLRRGREREREFFHAWSALPLQVLTVHASFLKMATIREAVVFMKFISRIVSCGRGAQLMTRGGTDIYIGKPGPDWMQILQDVESREIFAAYFSCCPGSITGWLVSSVGPEVFKNGLNRTRNHCPPSPTL